MEKINIKFIVSLMTLIAIVLFSCKGNNEDVIKKEKHIEMLQKLENNLNELKNVKYENSEEFIHFVINEKENILNDSIVFNTPITLVNEIAKIVENKYGYVTKKLFVKEFKENYKNVYKYMKEDYKNIDVKTPPDTIINISNDENNTITMTRE